MNEPEWLEMLWLAGEVEGINAYQFRGLRIPPSAFMSSLI